jgi:hypothetical protein
LGMGFPLGDKRKFVRTPTLLFSVASLWQATCNLFFHDLADQLCSKSPRLRPGASGSHERAGHRVCCSARGDQAIEGKEFSAVVFDLLLLDAQPEEGETVLKHLGSAAPVYLNFAITGTARAARELRWALQRRKREVLAAKDEAQQALRHELKDTLTALLLSCQMAMQVPELPAQAETKMQAVESLAREVSAKLAAI